MKTRFFYLAILGLSAFIGLLFYVFFSLSTYKLSYFPPLSFNEENWEEALPIIDLVEIEEEEIKEPVEVILTSPPPPLKDERSILYIIIDDVGSDRSQLDLFLTLNIPLSFAIMPHTRTSLEGYYKILNHKQEAILHMPMEPMSGEPAGYGQINVGDTLEEIENKLEKALEGFPSIYIFNNHMGSAVTSHRPSMRAILNYVQKNNLFFIDSFTHASSVAGEIAKEKGMIIAKRDIFLDNISQEEEINKMLNQALTLTNQKKEVVIIGHIWSKELFNVLKERQEELKRKVNLKFISEYFKDKI